MQVTKKIRTAGRVYQTEGLSGIVSTASDRLSTWWRGDHPLLGRIVELTGNVVKVDGLRFKVDHPEISREVKGLFLLNRYEQPEREALRLIDPDLPVVELGGSIGVVSCLTNKKLLNPRRHVVVEANPDLLPLLKRNRERNHCSFTIVHGAISYSSSVTYGGRMANFMVSDSILASSATQMDPRHSVTRTVWVPAVTLKEVLDRFSFQTCTLMCDIECGEVELVKREIDTIRERVSTIVMEIHTKTLEPETVVSTLATLNDAGFKLVRKIRKTYIFTRRQPNL